MDRLQFFWNFQLFNNFFLFLSEQTQDWSRGNTINDGYDTKWYKSVHQDAKIVHKTWEEQGTQRDIRWQTQKHTDLRNNERIDSETKIITRLRTKYISTLIPNECNNQNHTLTVTTKVIDSPQDPPFPSKEQYWIFQALY